MNIWRRDVVDIFPKMAVNNNNNNNNNNNDNKNK